MKNEKIRLAIMAPTLNLCNYLFGIEQGFFRKEGIEVEVIVRPGLRNTQAVAQGEADFGAANECVIQTALYGPTDLKILLQVLKDPMHDLIVQPEIQTLQDLRGKRITIPGSGSTPEIQTRLFFQKNGLIPDRDVFLDPYGDRHTRPCRWRFAVSGSVLPRWLRLRRRLGWRRRQRRRLSVEWIIFERHEGILCLSTPD